VHPTDADGPAHFIQLFLSERLHLAEPIKLGVYNRALLNCFQRVTQGLGLTEQFFADNGFMGN